MLASVQTFLNLGARAEQHRQAANAYKKLLRSFERIPASPEALPKLGDDSPLSRELRHSKPSWRRSTRPRRWCRKGLPARSSPAR